MLSLLLSLLVLAPSPDPGLPPCGDGAALSRAEAALNGGDYVGAVTAFGETVRHHPHCGRGWVGLARAWVGTGAVRRAWDYLDRASEVPRTAAGAALAQGVLYRRTGRPQQADLAFAEATRRDPWLAAAWIQRSTRSIEDLRLRRGLAELSRALSLDPEDPGIYLLFETWLEVGGEVRSLLTLYEERLKAGDRAAIGGLGDLFFRLGVVRTRQGKPLLASAYYRRALRGFEKLGDREGQLLVLLNLGWVTHTGRRDVSAALAWFDRALRLARELGDHEAEGRAWFNRGLVHAAAGSLQEADQDFRQALAACKGLDSLVLRKKALKEMGDLRLAEGDLEGAADSYRASLEVDIDRDSLQAGAEVLTALAALDQRIDSVLSILPPPLPIRTWERISPKNPIASALARGEPVPVVSEDWFDSEEAARLAWRLEHRKQELRSLASGEYRRHAEALIGGEEATQVRAGNFVVRSDYPSHRGVAAVAELLQETARLYKAYFGPVLVTTTGEPTTVYLLSRKQDFDQLTALFLNSASSRGHYTPEQGIIALHLERELRQNLIVSAVHEAVHTLNHRLLADGRASVPPWLDEGLAMYFALTRIDDRGRFHFGKVLEGRDTVKGASLEREGASWLRGLRLALSAGNALPLTQVVGESGREPFRGPDRHLYYAESWTLVHFLLHGEGKTWREPFLQFLDGIDEGRSELEDLQRVLGTEISTLEQAWRNYVVYDL